MSQLSQFCKIVWAKGNKNIGMKIIIVLILASLIVALIFLAFFFWAVKTGQYEDDYTPSMRILLDENTKNIKNPKI